MKKSSKVALWSIGVVLALTIIACLVFLSAFSGWGYCGNDIYHELVSPDKLHKAVIFQRDCGATTPFSTQVSILSYESLLPDESGNTYIAEGHPRDTELVLMWRNNYQLIIQNSDKASFKSELKVGEIELIYEFEAGI